VTVQPRGPACNVRVLQPRNFGLEEVPPYDLFGARQRAIRQWLVPGRRWFSPLVYYTGPFDDGNGLVGGWEFLDRYNISFREALEVFVTATETGFGIIPPVRKAVPWWIAYDEISQVELVPGTRGRLAIVTPGRARKIGVTTLTTRENRKAVFAGTPVRGPSALLSELGAQIVLR
jgi:hypothetical protein